MKSFVLSAMAVLLAAACSVKEDRSACPCTLIIDFTGLDISSFPQTDVRATSSGAPVLEEKVPAERYRDEYTASVPRTGTFLNLSYGDGGSFSHREGFTAMPGEEFPALYLQTEALDTENESVGIAADLHKVYCNITILMKSDGPYPYSVSVEGAVRGYGVDGALVRGPFSFSPVIDSGGKCSVRVPRQADSSLMLLIKEDDTTLREFALGEYIVESGYDWSAKDLEDVEIEIDYAKTDVVFKINGWETVISFDVII